MDALDAISQWLAKQHVVTYCVGREDALWCANAFYVYDRERVAFYLLSNPKSRHGEMAGRQARVAGTVNGQTKTVARIRGVQFAGELRLVEAPESEALRERYNRRFSVARVMSSPLWEIRLDEIKFTDNTLGFGKKLAWLRAEQA